MVGHLFKPTLTEQDNLVGSPDSLEFSFAIAFSRSLIHFLSCHCYQARSSGATYQVFSKIQVHFLGPSFTFILGQAFLQIILWESTLLTKVASSSSLFGCTSPPVSGGSQITKPVFSVVCSNGVLEYSLCSPDASSTACHHT